MATTWNPSDKSSQLTLSNGNLTIAGSVGVLDNLRKARATDSKSSGQWYFEVRLDAKPDNEYYCNIGICDGASSVDLRIHNDANGFAYFVAGGIYSNLASIGTSDAYLPNDVIGVAIDCDTHTVKFLKNNTQQGGAYTIPTGVSYFPAASAGQNVQVTGRFTAAAFSYTPPAGYSAWDSAAETTVTIDTIRQLTTDATANTDTLRRTGTAETVSIDTLRETITEASATIDTSRQTKSDISVTVDTSRRRTIAPGVLERLSIDLKSGVLADSYTSDQLSNIAIDTAYSASIYGWPVNYTVRNRSRALATGRHTLGGDYDISELLGRWINFSGDATDAVTIMGHVAAQIGKTLSINIDNHGVRRMSAQTTVMQVLSTLFGWTSDIPHQFVNVFIRGGALHVIQRGKESGTYELQSYNAISETDRKIDTLMNSSDWEPKIIGDPDGTYLDGTFEFNGVSITYDNGYVVEVVTSDDVTTFAYSADTDDSPDDNKYMTSKRNQKNGAGIYTRTGYNYLDYRGTPYLASEIEQDVMYVNSKYPEVIVRQRGTTYYPMQAGFYGSQSSEQSWVYGYSFFAGVWVQTLQSTTISATQTQVIEGRPGGPVTPRQRSGEENTPTVPIARTPRVSNHIPATDTETLQRYANGITWLDEKTEFTLRVDCYDAHIVDFDKTVTVAGDVWYLQSNQILLGPKATPGQSLELVRWE